MTGRTREGIAIISKGARACLFARNTRKAKSGANLYPPGIFCLPVRQCFSLVLRFFFIFCSVFVFVVCIETAALVQSFFDIHMRRDSQPQTANNCMCPLFFFFFFHWRYLFFRVLRAFAVYVLYGEYFVHFLLLTNITCTVFLTLRPRAKFYTTAAYNENINGSINHGQLTSESQ